MTTALIDLDPLIYSCGFAAQKTTYEVVEWDNYGNIVNITVYPSKKDMPESLSAPSPLVEIRPEVVAEPVENAIYLLRNAVQKILGATGATNYKAFLSGSTNFRNDIATIRPYKGNRDALHKPAHYRALREWAVGILGATIVEGMEADDAIAIENNTTRWGGPDVGFIDPRYVVCSVDKDMLQLPGRHYNPKKETLYWVSEQEAVRNFYQQVLSGDYTDNVAGVPGIGPRKATKLLDGCITEASHYDVCLREYNLAYSRDAGAFNGITGEAALKEVATLLWLKRSEDDVWSPPI